MKRPSFLAAMILTLLLSASLSFSADSCNPTIGVTLHPYYSWVRNIVDDSAKVVPILSPGSDPHSYQPLPTDIERVKTLDVLVTNGLGHDEFINPMLMAADNNSLKIINTSTGLPLIPSSTKQYSFEKNSNTISYNSHTYISITGTIQQIQLIARELGKLCPSKAKVYQKNGRAYTKKLRKMLSAAQATLDGVDTSVLRIATVHDGYAYLMQELGIKVSAVVQPRHGISPNARQLQDTIKRINRSHVKILFAELDYEKKYVDLIFQETGCHIYRLSHVSQGEYTKEYFEQAMQKNLQTIVGALAETARGK